MKKFTLILAGAAALFLGTDAYAQATRHAVILEIATGTWCTYCPGAAMGADELHDNASLSVGIVEHHDGDPWETTESAARYGAAYYAVTGFPTAWFDGGNAEVGGSHTQTMYPSYLPKVNAAMAVATPYDLTASWTQNGASVDISVTASQVGTSSASGLRLQAVLTESHIPVLWQDHSGINFVNRDMYPDQNGQTVTLTQGNSQTLNFNMPINGAWDQTNMELVVWLEDPSTKTIYNGRYMQLYTLAVGQDPTPTSVNNSFGPTSCMTSIAPEVDIRNMGNTAVTSVDFSYEVNGGTPMTSSWTGNLGPGSYATVTLPTVNFTPTTNNTLTVTITSNGDVNTGNNVVTKTWGNPVHTAGSFTMTIQPDNYGSETRWEIKSGAGAILASGGPYTDNNTTPIVVPVALSVSDCYQVIVYDSYGDGMCCAYGNGSYTLRNTLNAIVASGGEFASEDRRTFEVSGTTALTTDISNDINVYPNPSRGVFNIEIPNTSGAADISIMTLAGKLVYNSSTVDALVKVDLSSLAAGMYMVRVQTAEGTAVKKITKE